MITTVKELRKSIKRKVASMGIGTVKALSQPNSHNTRKMWLRDTFGLWSQGTEDFLKQCLRERLP